MRHYILHKLIDWLARDDISIAVNIGIGKHGIATEEKIIMRNITNQDAEMPPQYTEPNVYQIKNVDL
jgi:hypothetical protein